MTYQRETTINRKKSKISRDGSIKAVYTYNDYLELTPNKYKLSLRLYMKIIRLFMHYVVSDIIKQGLLFKFPYNLGTIKRIIKRRNIILNEDGDIDYEKSTLIRYRTRDFEKRIDKSIKMFNVEKEESISYICRIGRIKNRNIFYFKPSMNLWKH